MEVASLIIYPVKSCSGIHLKSMKLCEKGPLHDREWMIVKENGGFTSARKYPKLLTTVLQFTPDEKFIEVSIPNQEERLYLPIDPTKSPIVKTSPPSYEEVTDLPVNEKTVRVWGVNCGGEDVGDSAATFFSDFLGSPFRVVRTTPRVPPRKIGDQKSEQRFTVTPDDLVSYADGYPYLLANEASLGDLNSRIGGEKLPMNRFRPNIIIKGAEAWQEDTMKVLRIGKYQFSGSKCCARCKMTTIDQQEGKFDGKEPLQTMESFRRQKDYEDASSSGLMFGKNLIQMGYNENETQLLSIGDSVEVITTEDRTPLQVAPK